MILQVKNHILNKSNVVEDKESFFNDFIVRSSLEHNCSKMVEFENGDCNIY